MEEGINGQAAASLLKEDASILAQIRGNVTLAQKKNTKSYHTKGKQQNQCDKHRKGRRKMQEGNDNTCSGHQAQRDDRASILPGNFGGGEKKTPSNQIRPQGAQKPEAMPERGEK